jgi:hypothetical protein
VITDNVVIEIIASIERGVPDELKHAPMQFVRARLGDDICETRRTVTDFRGHHAGIGLHFLNRVDVEIGKRCSTHLRIRCVEAIHRENRCGAALTIHGKLLGEVGSAIGVGHRPSGE